MADNLPAAPQPLATGLISAEQQRAIAEVQARMVMARAQPRDQDRALELILKDCERLTLAESAIYAFARGGTDIRGPSIRLLESVASRWGNIASGIKILDRRDGYTECASYAWDLENNHYDERQFRVSHIRTTRRGSYQLTDERDIYEAEANAGQRRKRAALEAVIPRDIVEAAVARCEQTVASKADTSPEGIARMLETFAALGVTKQQIEVRIQRRIDAITPTQVIALRRIYTSLRDGMSAPGDWFEEVQQQQGSSPPPTGTEALRQRLAPKAPAKPVESDPVSDVSEQAGVEDTASVASPEASDTIPADPPSPPESPRDQPDQEPGHPEGDIQIAVIKPVRLRRGSGWDWERYADEYLEQALALPRKRLGEFRAKQTQMYNIMRDSAREHWERVETALIAREEPEY